MLPNSICIAQLHFQESFANNMHHFVVLNGREVERSAALCLLWSNWFLRCCPGLAKPSRSDSGKQEFLHQMLKMGHIVNCSPTPACSLGFLWWCLNSFWSSFVWHFAHVPPSFCVGSKEGGPIALRSLQIVSFPGTVSCVGTLPWHSLKICESQWIMRVSWD